MLDAEAGEVERVSYSAPPFSPAARSHSTGNYRSPSTAAKAVRKGKATNGWSFWKTKNVAGDDHVRATIRDGIGVAC